MWLAPAPCARRALVTIDGDKRLDCSQSKGQTCARQITYIHTRGDMNFQKPSHQVSHQDPQWHVHPRLHQRRRWSRSVRTQPAWQPRSTLANMHFLATPADRSEYANPCPTRSIHNSRRRLIHQTDPHLPSGALPPRTANATSVINQPHLHQRRNVKSLAQAIRMPIS
jgi:hypothetical protein